MPRSSRHKSHKQSKHTSKDAKDFLSDSEEDVKMKERDNTTKEGASGRVAIESSHLSSGEKRRLSSSFQSKDGYRVNGDASEEYVSSKLRKDKVDGISGGADKWTAGGDIKNDAGAIEKEMGAQISKLDSEKDLKSRESKVSSDVKSKSSRRHENGAGEDRDMASVLKEKEVENKSGSTRGDSKRKSRKDSGRGEGKDSRDTIEKERVSDRDSKKVQESKQESEARVNGGGVTKNRDYLREDADKDRPLKRGKENSELGILDELCNPKSEKEPEKRIHRKREGSGDRDKYQDAKENDYKNASSKGDPAKDGRYKDERYKDERYKAGIHRENHQDNMEKDDGHRDDKYREREGGDRNNRRRNDKYRDGAERESRKEGRQRNDGDKDSKYREDDERDVQLRDDKYHEDKEREIKHRDDKYLEGGKDSRRDSRYYENGDRGVGLKDEKYRGKNDRHKEERRREDYEKDSEFRDGRDGDNFDRGKRVREAKSKDDRSFRDRSGDKIVAKNLREETHSSELLPRKSSFYDDNPSYDDRSRLKGTQGRKRTSDKDDYNDMRARGFKDQKYDLEKRSGNDVRVDQVSERGRSGSRYTDVEATSIRRHSPSSGSHVTGDQHRLLKQDDLKYREYAYEERVGHSITSTREFGNAAGVTEKISLTRSNEVIPKGDDLMGELSGERRMILDTRNSPRQLVTPSSSSADRRHWGKSDFRRSDDVEDSGQRDGGFKEAKNYSGQGGRGTREMASETFPGDEPSLVDGDDISMSSPYPRNSYVSSSSKSFSHPFPPPFRSGIDSPQGFRSAEDDGRMRSINRHRRNGDPNMVRVQGSPWKGLPNWPSHMANGFMPFQHGPVGFHPAMQPFPGPPIIGMRPSMELNHPGGPYPVPDGDRLPLHAHHVGWRTPMYDPCPPQLRSWETNDAAISGDPRLFGRQDWHHGRPLQGVQPWETGGDSWKNSKPVASFEQPPAFVKDDNQSIHCPEDLTPPSQPSEQAKMEQTYRAGEYVDATQTSDIVNKKTPVASEDVPEEETPDAPQISQKNDALLCHVYLSMLEISADLTDPELYSKYKDLVNGDEKMPSDTEDDKHLDVEAPKAKASYTSELLSGSLFPTINDSLLQKSMSLYRKHRVGFMISGKIAPTPAVDEGDLHSDPEKVSLRGHEAEVVKSDVEDIHPKSIEVEQSNGLENLQYEPVITNTVEMSEDLDFNSKGQVCTLEKSILMETKESQSGGSLGKTEAAIPPSDALSNQLPPSDALSNQLGEQILAVAKLGSMNLSNAVSKAHEVDAPELLSGSGPVNLNRIHHSAESTH